MLNMWLRVLYFRISTKWPEACAEYMVKGIKYTSIHTTKPNQ